MSIDNVDRHADYDTRKLFLLSVIALATSGMVFSIRGATIAAMQKHFFETLDPTHAAGLITGAAAAAFIGGAFAVFIGSPLTDVLGMGRLLLLGSLCHIVGTLAI